MAMDTKVWENNCGFHLYKKKWYWSWSAFAPLTGLGEPLSNPISLNVVRAS